MERPTFASDISREQFDTVRERLEGARKRTRPRKHDLYDVFNAVLYLLDSGVSWRSLPPGFPPWRTVHEYFTQWTMPRETGPPLLEETLLALELAQPLERLRTLMNGRSVQG